MPDGVNGVLMAVMSRSFWRAWVPSLFVLLSMEKAAQVRGSANGQRCWPITAAGHFWLQIALPVATVSGGGGGVCVGAAERRGGGTEWYAPRTLRTARERARFSIMAVVSKEG